MAKPIRKTIRQTIAELLAAQEMTSRQLADALLLTPGEVEGHLGHLARSLKGRLRVRPAACRDCGYSFRDRKRLDAPGRCPRCRGQRLEGPWFKALS